jgi:hypothetical protein
LLRVLSVVGLLQECVEGELGAADLAEARIGAASQSGRSDATAEDRTGACHRADHEAASRPRHSWCTVDAQGRVTLIGTATVFQAHQSCSQDAAAIYIV